MELCNYGRFLKVDTSFLPDYANCNYFRNITKSKKKRQIVMYFVEKSAI